MSHVADIPLDCACVIHGSAYDWTYVDRLFNMLQRHLTRPVRLHVYTETDRPVPDHMIKHSLQDWGFSSSRQSWWYKLQLFNTQHHLGPLLYFDLDVVIANNIDWLWQHNLKHFWTIRDFKYLWKPNFTGANTSIMWWNTAQYAHVWQAVQDQNINTFVKKYRGDQDLVSDIIPVDQRRFFHTDRIKSWRWQCLDGGFNFVQRKHLAPGTGTDIDKDTSILVFHGSPKPHEISDKQIVMHWC